MVRISILYPNKPDGRFDMAYYLETHMPASIERLSAGKGFQGVAVDRGLAGGTPGAPPAYVAMCQYLFDTVEDFMAAFAAHADFLQGDMANYTDIVPVIQVSDVAIAR